MERFTRREAQIFTRSSLNRLTYLEKARVVVPHRVAPPERPALFYTWEQILEIRAINRLRRQVSFQTIRKILQFLDEQGFEKSLRDKFLVAGDGDVSWVRLIRHPTHPTTTQVIQIVGKHHSHTGQFMLTPPPSLENVLDDCGKLARPGTIVDFEYFRHQPRDP